MNSTERALRALRVQVQFELAQTAAQVAAAAAIHAGRQRRVNALVKHSDAVSTELSGALRQQPMNPALLVTMRRMYRSEHQALQEARAQAEEAQHREQQARELLTSVRNQDRSLERAVQAERRRRQQRARAIEIDRADESWLQRRWRAGK